MVRDTILLVSESCSRCGGTGMDGSIDAWTVLDEKIRKAKEDLEHFPVERTEYEKV